MTIWTRIQPPGQTPQDSSQLVRVQHADVKLGNNWVSAVAYPDQCVITQSLLMSSSTLGGGHKGRQRFFTSHYFSPASSPSVED